MQRTLLLLLVAVSYLLLAGGRPWSLGPIAVLAAIAALSAPRRTFRFPREHRLLDLALVAIAIAVAIQLLPLPTQVVDLVSPSAARIKAALQFSTADRPAWTTLSIAIREIRIELWRLGSTESTWRTVTSSSADG